MGKYTKKAKIIAGVALTADVSQSYLGVRTQTKTLPFHRRISTAAVAPPPYELRHRFLEKSMQQLNSPDSEEDAEIGSNGVLRGIEIHASFEENNLEFDVRERGCSLCSSIRDDDTIPTPGSTTRRECSSAATLMNSRAPSARELEEFFAREEQAMQRHFIDKYNFDIVVDVPLPGRYEWVAVRP